MGMNLVFGKLTNEIFPLKVRMLLVFNFSNVLIKPSTNYIKSVKIQSLIYVICEIFQGLWTKINDVKIGIDIKRSNFRKNRHSAVKWTSFKLEKWFIHQNDAQVTENLDSIPKQMFYTNQKREKTRQFLLPVWPRRNESDPTSTKLKLFVQNQPTNMKLTELCWRSKKQGKYILDNT